MMSSGNSENQPGFKADIRPLFREYDIQEMKDISGFDLSDYDDVRKWADMIYERIADQTMPCDEPWSAEKLALLKNWMESGMLE